ncbi:MAG: LysR family transcriptional regulator [Burkholderiaceae bacterium]
MKNVSLRQLRVFAEVARRLSFVRAADALHLTAPAVTMQVKDLESAVGLPLFDRRGRVVSLTTTGEYLLVYARRMIATMREAEDAMARIKRVDGGLLNVGLVSTAKYFVPRLLARFRAEHPGVEIRLQVSGNRDQLVTLLQDREIDLAIMGRPPKELATHSHPIAAHPMVITCAPDHPLVRKRAVTAVVAADQPFIARELGSGTRKAMDDYFATWNCPPRIVMEMSSNETIKQAVMAGMGISLLSLHTLGLEMQSKLLRLLKVEGTPLMRTWFIVHMASKGLSPVAEAFRQFMLAQADAYLEAHDRPLLHASFGRAVVPAA